MRAPLSGSVRWRKDCVIERAHIQLLPGMDGTGRLFRWLVHALEPEMSAHVVRYPVDQPLRTADLVELVRQQAPRAPYVMVAESYSGAVGLAAAAKRPANLRGLILSTAFVAPPVPSWLRFAPLGALLRLRPLEPVVRLLLVDQQTGPDVVTEIRAAIRAVSPAVLVARLREMLIADSREALRACPAPVLYLAAAGDRLIGLRGLRTIQRLKPEIESVILEGPHLLLQARPDEAARTIKRYVQRWQ